MQLLFAFPEGTMYPYLTVFGLNIPVYWLCGMAGGAVCTVLLLVRHRYFRDLLQVDITNAAALGLVGMILGARLLYLLTILPPVLENLEYLRQHTDTLKDILFNGMVFYGGLFGFLAAVLIYMNKYRLERARFWDYTAPCLPLFHAFGRIGCFFSGCCYGFESEELGLVFARSIGGPNDRPFFPLQLVGSAGEFCLFAAVLLFERKHRGQGKALPFYLTVYAVGRFAYEFFRGDEIRGIFGGLSVSQWISLAVLLALIIRSMLRRRRAKKAEA